LPEQKPILCYVTDRRALGEPPAATHRLLRVMHAAAQAGVHWIQIREKEMSGRALSALAGDAMRLAANSRARILINDRLDVALAAGAGGVHLGGESLPVRDVAAWCARHFGEARREKFLLGASCHAPEEALAAERDGADYIFFGPVFATPSKLRFGPPQGVERLGEVCRRVRLPVLAIGGVTLENAAECLRAGAAGIAAIRLFQEASDVQEVVKSLRVTLAPDS
jgi:thiamine-phosphate pyrophosphorylase